MSVLYGVGIDDLPYKKKERDKDGKTTWECPYYSRWRGMIRRCYSDIALTRNPKYSGCTVCDEWLVFSNFKSWMETQDWEGKHLDKDILFVNNKLYSQHTCVWVEPIVNTFVCGEDKADNTSGYTGVTYQKDCGKWKAQCKNTFGITPYQKRGYLGLYLSKEEAYFAWKARKYELACKLAESKYVTDDRVAEALRNRYKQEETAHD
ncbi:HNH endonuclease [Vibrio phage 11895-B1]|uniref:HNH endonuclease n=1 Tax=Vibrio phage 11895-B1 TaxID=754075 RepID=UPI0002C0E6C1|nr:HNH endonuclease [Vibrio phage 11895-B1]AGH32149.1 hypothetical protein VPHG_00082 [Vibrio phage 11895-B1]